MFELIAIVLGLALGLLVFIVVLAAFLMYMLAGLALFLFRDCVVAFWDVRFPDAFQDIARAIWTVIPPVAGGRAGVCHPLFIPESQLSR